MLHFALRKVLGPHVEQKGSFVSPDVLRFDFSHFGKMSNEELRMTERLVAAAIRENVSRDERRDIPLGEARSMGATALFGEKYGDRVRVVRFGDSVELCGGTHVSRTGDIGSFRIVSEASIAAGIRRIEAVTAERCEDYLYAQQDLMNDIRNMFNNAPDLVKTMQKIFDENQELKNMIEGFKREKQARLKIELSKQIKNDDGTNMLVVNLHLPADIIKDLAFGFRSEYSERFVFVAGGDAGNKPSITLALSDDLVNEGFDAAKIVRAAAKKIQGGGGGQPHFATAGGKNPDGLVAAIDEIRNLFVKS